VRPAFPAPSLSRRRVRLAQPGRNVSREGGSVAGGCLEWKRKSSTLSSRTSERSERDPGPITTVANCYARAGAAALHTQRVCGYGSRLSPGRRKGTGGAGRKTRSTPLTIFWHCSFRHFSFRTTLERGSGNKPSTVLAENPRFKGSGNADSQRKVRSSGRGGQGRWSRGDSGCVLAHPASRRASASYRPLRAVWALCAWALRGSREINRPLQRSRQQRTRYKEFSKWPP